MDTARSPRSSPLALLVGLVVVVAALTWTVGWALPVVIAAIIVMVMGHEFGHFITAKRAGLLVTDFFVGFGPVVWSTTRGETRYGVRALLLGGYVKVPGMSWVQPVEPALESRTYRSASYPRQVLFASAGSLMHGVMALVLAWASLTLFGLPSASHVGVLAFSQWDGHKENAAQLAGLHLGDRVVAVNGKTITSSTQLAADVHHSAGRRLTLLIERDGHDLTLHATPVDGRRLRVGGVPLASGGSPEGFLGVEVGALTVRSSLLGAVPSALSEVGSTIVTAVHGLAHVFTPGEFSNLFHQVASPAAASSPSNQASRPVSIVGVVRIAVQGAQAGPGTLIYILVSVNVFVGIFNMMPILPLDGGYVAIATYERIRSRRGTRYHADVNRLAPLIYAFVSVLLVLFATTLYLDIAHPIANPFG